MLWAGGGGRRIAGRAGVGAELKIGVVDYGRLVEESPQAKAAMEPIRTEFTPRAARPAEPAAVAEGEGGQAAEGRRHHVARTSAQRAEKDLRDGDRDLQRKQSEVQDDFNARRNEEMSRLQRTLIEQVRTYAKAQNFDLVIADGVIYATPALDITPADPERLCRRSAPAASRRRPPLQRRSRRRK